MLGDDLSGEGHRRFRPSPSESLTLSFRLTRELTIRSRDRVLHFFWPMRSETGIPLVDRNPGKVCHRAAAGSSLDVSGLRIRLNLPRKPYEKDPVLHLRRV